MASPWSALEGCVCCDSRLLGLKLLLLWLLGWQAGSLVEAPVLALSRPLVGQCMPLVPAPSVHESTIYLWAPASQHQGWKPRGCLLKRAASGGAESLVKRHASFSTWTSDVNGIRAYLALFDGGSPATCQVPDSEPGKTPFAGSIHKVHGLT